MPKRDAVSSLNTDCNTGYNTRSAKKRRRATENDPPVATTGSIEFDITSHDDKAYASGAILRTSIDTNTVVEVPFIMSKRGAATTTPPTNKRRSIEKDDHISVEFDKSSNFDEVNAVVTALSSVSMDGRNAIDVQKERAMKFWNASNYNEDIQRTVDDDVMNHLHQGLVVPIFHTLCRHPNKRLFLPNTRVGKMDKNSLDVIHLSSAQVIMGVCEDTSKVVLFAIIACLGIIIMIGLIIRSRNQVINKDNLLEQAALLSSSEIQQLHVLGSFIVTILVIAIFALHWHNNAVGTLYSKKERSYIPAFFRNDTAYNKVEDSSFTWEFDEDFTELVTDLVNAPARMVGEDIEVTKLKQPFDVDSFNGNNLITRRLSRGVVADCLALSKEGSTYAITGSPGIGKSWTLIYTLQQALLFENACVIFCFQKQGTAIVCIRRNNKIYVWKNKNDRWKTNCSSNLFDNSSVLVLLDPRESKKGGAELSEGLRMGIIAASNNVKHLASSSKTTPLMDLILSVATEKELEVAIPFMIEGDKLPAEIEEIIKRSKIVGRLPRYIVSENGFRSRERETRNAITKLESDEIHDILSFDGLISNESTIPGCLFSVNVRLASNIQPDASIINTPIGQDEAENAYDGTYDEANLYVKVGYDGQCIRDYWERDIRIMSETVRTAIAQTSRKNILSFWGMHEEGLAEMGHYVEDLFWQDLKNQIDIKIFPMKNQKEHEEALLKVIDCDYLEKVDVDELRDKVFYAHSSIVCRMNKNSTLIDFAGPNLQVYQVTVSNKHTMSINGLRELFVSSRHCKKKRDGNIVKSSKADIARLGKIKFYWVVPPGRATAWKNKKRKTIAANNGLLKECLDEYVDQFILVMDIDPKK